MEIKDLKKDHKSEKIVDGIKPLDLCVLNSKKLLISDYLTKVLAIVDENFSLIKQINKINDNPFKPSALANSNDKIYVANDENMKIYIFDHDLKLIDSVDTSDDGKPYRPYGICYSNDIIYVCDVTNNKIQTYTKELKLIKSFQLDSKPWYIKVIDNIACMRVFDGFFICFYTLPSFTLKYRYHGHRGFIVIADSRFIEFCQPNKIYYCYNKDGLIIDKNSLLMENDIMLDNYDPIVYFNNKLIVAQCDTNKLIMS